MHTDHRGIGDAGVAEQDGLQFGRRHLVALVFDEFFQSVDDVDAAVGIDLGEVSSVQESVGIDGLLSG